jgi:hypothetical protein
MLVLSHLLLDILRLQLFRNHRLWLNLGSSFLFLGLPLLVEFFSPALSV